MSEINTAFDCRPVYFDSDGFPLRNGKLFFYEIGTTNPKYVYSDYLNNTPLGNEILLNSDGRSPTQLFYGVGNYSVSAHKFIGTDPNTAPPEDWSLDNQWVQSGGEDIPLNDSVTLVNTIQDLRALDQNANTVALLLGYYEAGDKRPIIYKLKANADSDNGGTIIKNSSIAGTSWIYEPEADKVGADVFGLIPNTTTSRNSQINALVNYCFANKKTAYIQKGIYYFANGSVIFTCPVFIEEGVTFRCEGGGSYIVKIYNQYDIRLSSGLKSLLSTNDVVLEIYTTGTVNPKWWGCLLDSTNDDSANFIKCLEGTKSFESVVNITGGMKLLGHTSDILVNRDILFSDAGIISNQNTSYFVHFKSMSITNKTISANRPSFCFAESNLTKYKFEAVDIKASWFTAGSESNYTLDLSKFLGSFEIVEKARFILDAKSCQFSTNLSMSYGSKYTIVPDIGIIQNTASVINFKSIEGIDYVYNVNSTGNIIVRDGVTHFKWFTPYTTTTEQSTKSWQNAIYCAMHGNLRLDIDCATVYIGSTSSSMSSNGSLEVYNGFISCISDTKSVFDFVSSTIDKIYIHDLKAESSTGVQFSLIYLNGTNVNSSIVIERVNFVSDVTTSMPLIQINSSSFIYDLIIDKSNITSYKLCGQYIQNITSTIVTNSVMNCICDFSASSGSIFSGNSILGSMSIYDKLSKFYGTITNNNFYNNSVAIVSNSANSIFEGMQIINNGLASISLSNGTGSFAPLPQLHRLICGNNFNEYGTAKKTFGKMLFGVLNSAIETGSVGDVVSGPVYINNQMLLMPSGSPINGFGFGNIRYSGPSISGKEYTLMNVETIGTTINANFRIDYTQPVGGFTVQLEVYWGAF